MTPRNAANYVDDWRFEVDEARFRRLERRFRQGVVAYGAPGTA